MRNISNSQLDKYCVNSLNSLNKNDAELFSIVFVLYNTGLRINEVIDLSRWSQVSENVYSVLISKSDGLRLINKSLLNNYFINLLNSGKSFTFHTYRSIDYSISKTLPCVTSNYGSNFRRSHLFRYNYCRRLFDAGATVTEVSQNILHKNLQTTNIYLFSLLSTAF